MVQKKGKHGIRTGNTIRAVNTKYVRRYRKDAWIIRRDLTFILNDHTDVLGDVIEGADIPCADLIYSLNKNRRWLLPDLIKEIQTDNADDKFGKVDFELVERDKLLQNNNCFELYTSYIVSNGGDFIRKTNHIQKAPKHIYLDADNVLKTPPIYSRQYRRLLYLSLYTSIYPEEEEFETVRNKEVFKTDTELDTAKGKYNCNKEQKDVQNEIPRVRYEVFHPCELTNVITQKPKRIGNNTEKTFKCRNYNRRPWTLRGYQFRSRVAKDSRNDINYEIEEGLEEYTLEHETFKKYAKVEKRNREVSTLLNENENVKSKASVQVKTKTLSKRTLKNVDSAKEKADHNDTGIEKEKRLPVVLLTSEEDTNVSSGDDGGEEETVFFPRKISILPVCVLLRQEEINVDALHHEYEDDVLECKGSPRRFIINISKYIQDLDLEGIGSAYKLLRIMNKTMFSWLIFVHDPKNKLNSVTEKAFYVSLNANFNEDITQVKIGGLVEGTTVSISTVIEKTIKYVKYLPRESMIFEMKPNINKYRPIVKTSSLLEEMKHWSCWTYVPDNFYVLKHLLESESSSVNIFEAKHAVTQKGQEQTKTPLCSICYRYSNVKFALLFCFHSFCNACWEAYIHEKFELGSNLIYCPEKDCTAQVDIGTIMSFLSVKEIFIFARRCHNMAVEKNKLAKWCTNEACGRVIFVNASRSKSLRCSCGELLCFTCSGIPHWPLPCRKYLDYVQILLDTRDKNICPHEFVIKFDVKYCHICFKVVKHYDRCMTTDCPCGSVLCFRCSSLWHAKSMSIYQPRENTTTSLKSCESYTAQRNNIFLTNKRTKWYKLAMKHRLHQHPYRVAKLQASSKLLANRISHYILREERKGNYVNIDFAVDDTSYLRESERATHYMTYIVEMYKETSNIIENTSFFLNDDSGSEQEAKELLHRRAMILSTCAKTILDLVKDGAFLNPKVVIERLNGTTGEIRRVMGCIVKDL